MVKRKHESEQSPSPKKKFNKNGSLSAVDEVKSPKVRRKSTGKLKILQNVIIRPAGPVSPKKTLKNTPKKTPRKAPKDPSASELDKTQVDAEETEAGVEKTRGDARKTEEDAKKTRSNRGKFNIPEDTVKKAVKASIASLENNSKVTRDASVPLFLQINAVKAPKVHPKILRIPLANSMLTPDSEVCLIVAEAKDITNNKHVEYYKSLLRSNGVENVNKIMTLHEFRTEYDTSEAKTRLVELYDSLLVDGRIASKVARKCGTIFYQKRKLPTPVSLEAGKLKGSFEKALRKTQMHVHSKGNKFGVQFGHGKMRVRSLVENVYSVLEGLDKEFPGGWENIQSVRMKSRGVELPIYLASKNLMTKSKVKLPKTCATVRDEVSTARLNTEVVVHPSVDVKNKKADVSEKDEEQQLQDLKRQQKMKLKIKKKYKKSKKNTR